MEKVSIEDVEPSPYDEDLHADRRDLSEPLDASAVAIVRYILEPDERFSGSIHAHMDQEEVFVVLDREATFETRASERGADRTNETGPDESQKTAPDANREITVGAGEAIRFAPGEFQSGWNDSDERVVALALGAPRGTEDVRISSIPVLGNENVECPECGHDHMRIPADAESGLVCPECRARLDVG